MKKRASATWEGDLKKGKGTISSESGVLDSASFGFNTRFEDGKGTNPEELIGAAHAGCFAMAFSNELSSAGFPPRKVEASAVVHLEQKDGGFSITRSELTVKADVPDADEESFRKALSAAEAGCPVSKVLNAEVTVDVERV